MAIRLERTIWPVGHGAFYTEQFKDEDNVLFTAVYDCGSEQEKALEKCIKEFLPGEDTLIIDALFISHFHADHVNKLGYLLQKNVSVLNLFIPQLTDNYVLSILASNMPTGNRSVNNDLIERLYFGGGLEKVETIYEVPQINSDYVPEGEYRGTEEANYAYAKAPLIYSNPKIPFWVYVPCNIFAPNSQLVQEFINAGYGDSTGKNVDINRVFGALKSGLWKDMQDQYGKVFPKDHNEYSMTVYSGFAPNVIPHSMPQNVRIEANAYYQNQPCYSCYYDSILHKEVGCLYTGDFEARTYGNTLIRFYTQNYRFWDRVRMMQIPHHGSYKDNYYQALYIPTKVVFASTAINDKYGHPHVQTLANISAMKCPIVMVQDNKATALVVIYDINFL